MYVVPYIRLYGRYITLCPFKVVKGHEVIRVGSKLCG